MKQSQQVLIAIANFVEANNISIYSVQGYFGFAYLTIEYSDMKKKYKFDFNTKTDKVDWVEVPGIIA